MKTVKDYFVQFCVYKKRRKKTEMWQKGTFCDG